MKTALTIFLLLFSLHCFSQTTSSAKKDTLIQLDGTKYIGTVITTTINGDNTSQIQFMTEDGQMHNVPSSAIAQLKRANQQDNNTLPPADKKISSVEPAHSSFDDETSIDWSSSNIPHEALKKHRVGLGLTISGGGLIVGGVVLAAGAANTSSTSYSNGVTTQTNVKVNGLGVLFILAGLPMVIVGAIKLNKAKRIAHNSMIRVK